MKPDVDLSAIRAAIAAEPWSSLGIAFLAGACLALLEPRSKVARTIATTAGTIALAALREAARERVSTARSWIDARVAPYSQHAAT